MLPENIVQLALKSRKEGLTVKEREFLDQWLLENVELQEEFHQLVVPWYRLLVCLRIFRLEMLGKIWNKNFLPDRVGENVI